MEESLMEVVPRLEKRTHYLATFANLATLLGLLGTIVGLIVAIPLLLVHAVIQTKTTELVDSLEMASVKFLNTIVERRSESAA
jgi:biopolymer transport protein ExbB/TolQ